MRLGVLDVGSNTVHLLIVDAHPGASPVPYHSERTVLRLMRFVEADGSISEAGIDALQAAIRSAVETMRQIGVDDILPTATSAIREATNGIDVLARIEHNTGVTLRVLSGEDEARITMLAVRRWFGWSAGEILLFDIGGGSFEIAQGADEYPEVSVSLPLGAGRMTREFLPDDPPLREDISRLRAHARAEFTQVRQQFKGRPKPQRVVGTSKTIRSLARLVGGVPDNIESPPPMTYANLRDWEPRLRDIPASARQLLPGITPERAIQIVAGAVVVRTAMKVFGVESLDISPWALREGIVLRYIDALDNSGADPVSLSFL
jgi:exopolyphosphatase/guanosine-5'-triphosphate,3'-diphosphate pyrophosphatase